MDQDTEQSARPIDPVAAGSTVPPKPTRWGKQQRKGGRKGRLSSSNPMTHPETQRISNDSISTSHSWPVTSMKSSTSQLLPQLDTRSKTKVSLQKLLKRPPVKESISR